ncbi:acyl-CoA-binding protein [Rhodofomes roseus]|uniref:Acyl-CoA-binding protein n=1 Tax=Rhodofomes roseus TaxID=34475 RepID=A0ABQ8K4J3_9APHY|nr:acyl-CoA-binding protein [Rhodofomes roseus]KAH9831536.1 acyl-CoA-binding protein [Rhodofomes roseus]
MSVSETKFEKAVQIIQGLPKDGPVKPTQDDQLFFYKYYKQATVGDVNTTRPGMLDFVGKAKWDAWKSVEGTSQEEARAKYIEKLLEILQASGDEDSKKYIAEIEAA